MHHFSSKSGKIGAVSALGTEAVQLIMGGATAEAATSFHASSSSQDQYRFGRQYSGGSSVLLSDGVTGLTTSEVKMHVRAFLPVSSATSKVLHGIGVHGAVTQSKTPIVNRAVTLEQTSVVSTRSTILISPRIKQIKVNRNDAIVKVIRGVKVDARVAKGQIMQPQGDPSVGDKRNIRGTEVESLQPLVKRVIRQEFAPAPVRMVPVMIQRGTAATGLGYAREHTVTLQRKGSVGVAVTPVIMLQRKSAVGLVFNPGCV